MAFSSYEAEYVAALYATCQPTWIDMILEEFKIMEPKKMKLFVDNKSTTDLENHPVCHG